MRTLNEASAVDKTRIFADMCRLNTLYMIARAGSGHVGSSFSSLDVVSWLYLNELKNDDLYFSSKGHDAPGPLLGADRARQASLRQAARAAPLGRPSRAPRRRRARHGHQHRLARHGHLQGQGHGARRPAEGPQAALLRADRRRRAAGGPDLGVADLGRQCRHGRDHRDRRPQQAAVGLPREPDERPRRPRGQVQELRLACRALRRSRPRCVLARARSLRRSSRASASDHRRHRQGTRRLLHGAHRDGFRHRHVSLPLRRAR